jgi:hypothetical protein
VQVAIIIITLMIGLINCVYDVIMSIVMMVKNEKRESNFTFLLQQQKMIDGAIGLKDEKELSPSSNHEVN